MQPNSIEHPPIREDRCCAAKTRSQSRVAYDRLIQKVQPGVKWPRAQEDAGAVNRKDCRIIPQVELFLSYWQSTRRRWMFVLDSEAKPSTGGHVVKRFSTVALALGKPEAGKREVRKFNPCKNQFGRFSGYGLEERLSPTLFGTAVRA
ncbi:hypothetical protein BDZ89DRAFT_215666 [Hymenopellis radicata]|nr:hypothetical protein BDZ89DRAFT_215666 [Hymenopellis radicata]